MSKTTAKNKIYIVSNKRDNFYNLTDLIPEMMADEDLTEQQAIDYFMENLEGSRYMVFPSHTQTSVITTWITQDMDLDFDFMEPTREH